MPSAKMGQPNDLDKKLYFQLTGKGEKVTLRFGNLDYHYEGQHFLSQAGSDKKTVTPCQRINNKLDCQYCNKYFDLMRAAKDIADEKDRKTAEEAAGKAWKVALSFYYPALNRATKSACIFQTKLSVRLALEQEIAEGVDVLKYDWVITRTQDPGKSYYTVKRVDSSETKKLDKDETGELLLAQAMNVSDIISGKHTDVADESEVI